MVILILWATLVFVGVFLCLIVLLRRIGKGKWPTKRPVVAIVQPPNTTCLIISSPNTESIDKDGKITGVNNDGGPFVRILHSVDGKYLDESDPDPMNHKMVTENLKSGRVEKRRDLFYDLFGLQFIWFFRYVEISSIRKTRWGRRDDQAEYSLQAKTSHSLYPDFSGQHDIKMDGVETGKVLKFNIRLNFTLEETYPYRARKRTADSYAQFTIMVNDHVVYMMGRVDPTEFIGGKEDQEAAKDNLKKKLIASFSVEEVWKRIEDETGLTIRKASFPEFDFDEDTRKLLEAFITAELEGKAAVRRAELEKEAELQRIEAEAKRVQDVTIPAARDENTVKVRWAEAYEKNKTMTTVVTGSATPMIPLGK